ncbi:MAG: hypothetical protein LIR50_05460 [Bacillota bacterium]|nr:hypothetical protein [Bacillota bacterium]
MDKCKLIMIINNDKIRTIKDNIDYVLANQLRIFKEMYDNRENIEYKIVSI